MLNKIVPSKIDTPNIPKGFKWYLWTIVSIFVVLNLNEIERARYGQKEGSILYLRLQA